MWDPDANSVDKAVLDVPKDQEVAFVEQGNLGILARCRIANALREELLAVTESEQWGATSDDQHDHEVCSSVPLSLAFAAKCVLWATCFVLTAQFKGGTLCNHFLHRPLPPLLSLFLARVFAVVCL